MVERTFILRFGFLCLHRPIWPYAEEVHLTPK